MTKRADEIWSEVPGFPKLMLVGGIFLVALRSVMDWFGNPSWWFALKTTVQTLGNIMIYPGMILCAAALIAGGLAAISKD